MTPRCRLRPDGVAGKVRTDHPDLQRHAAAGRQGATAGEVRRRGLQEEEPVQESGPERADLARRGRGHPGDVRSEHAAERHRRERRGPHRNAVRPVRNAPGWRLCRARLPVGAQLHDDAADSAGR